MFRFDGGKVTTTLGVETLQPPARVGWKTIESNAPCGWDGTTIIFDLQVDGDDTVVAIAHRGFAEEEESDGYARANDGWAQFLVSLQQFAETGRGAPHPDVDFSRVVR